MHQKTKSTSSHFHGKEALEHVIEARLKGHAASEEIHGVEMPGHISALADAAKETSLLFIVLWTILAGLHMEPSTIHWALVIFASGWLVWKTGRSALLGWTRLERMHRVIEEERWEIEHHRPQEKEELRALYQAKGFSGRLLEEAVDVLMADDNRLLQVMLQEELGFQMESEEHPLKQATGAALGILISSAVMAFALFVLPPIGTILSGAVVIACTAGLVARFERNLVTRAIVWNLGVAALALGTAYFALQLVFPE
jgi:hypothetical protein